MSKKVVPREEGTLTGTTLKIPVADWVEDYAQQEADLSSLEKAIRLQVERNLPPATMGILYLIGGLRGEIPVEVAIFPKTTLLVGASAIASRRLAAQGKRFEAPSGKTFTVRKFVANVVERPDDEDEEGMAMEIAMVSPGPYSYTETGTQGALDNAGRYLLNRIPGYIFGRLKIIAACGGDVGALADMLKEKIDDMVDRLVEPIGT